MMLSTTKKILSLGMKLYHMTKNEMKKEVKLLTKAGVVKKGDAKTLAKACLKEAKTEKLKIMRFAKTELKKETGKTSVLAQILKQRGQKALKAHGIEIKVRKGKK